MPHPTWVVLSVIKAVKWPIALKNNEIYQKIMEIDLTTLLGAMLQLRWCCSCSRIGIRRTTSSLKRWWKLRSGKFYWLCHKLQDSGQNTERQPCCGMDREPVEVVKSIKKSKSSKLLTILHCLVFKSANFASSSFQISLAILRAVEKPGNCPEATVFL